MKNINKIWLLFFLLGTTILSAQTPGFNYQALILNSEEIQIPGTNVVENKVPLGLEDVILRFTITDENNIEYIEEHTVTTDENGMVSLIVGEGTPVTNNFDDINWDGELKYLNVELNILNNNNGFVFLDTQKILYIPHPSHGTNIDIVDITGNLPGDKNKGDLVWVENYDGNQNPTLMIWDGTQWTPVAKDFDPTNELGLVVVSDDTDRSNKFMNPKIGDQVWNQNCNCIEVFDGTNWVTNNANVLASNGLYKNGNTVKLGGNLTEPTIITTDPINTLALKGLEQSTNNQDQIVVVDKNTGVVKQKSLSSIIQKEQVVIIATDGQLVFPTPLAITDTDKIDVYRNGARIDFTAVNSTTIKLEPEAQCYQNDKIRIVQLY
jgi:hypothetical protein